MVESSAKIMTVWIFLSGILAPALFWIAYFMYKDRLRPEPFTRMGISYLPHLEGFALFGRAFASPLTHTIFASIWGYTVGSAHIEGRGRIRAAVLGLILAGTCHGLFNFLTTSAGLRVLGSLLILAVWIWQIRVLEREAAMQRRL